MYLTSLSIQQDSLLYLDIQQGKFTAQTEFDVIKEFYVLLKNLKNPIRINTRAGYNPVYFYIDLPDNRKDLLKEFKALINNYNEQTGTALVKHRASYATI